MSDNSRHQAEAQLASIKEMLQAVENAADDDEREAAEQAIYDDPLAVDVRSGWVNAWAAEFEPVEYRVLLCTGGPAVQLEGELDDRNQPYNVQLQHQDWFEPWQTVPLNAEDTKALLTYVRHFFPY